MTRRIVGLLVALLAGCAPIRINAPQDDVNLLNRCMHMPGVAVNICGSGIATTSELGNAIAMRQCVRNTIAPQMEQLDHQGRCEWLLGMGCPPHVVSPGGTMRQLEPAAVRQ